MIANHLNIRLSLSRFLVVSILLHLLLIVSFGQWSPMAANRLLGQTVIDVQLQSTRHSPSAGPVSSRSSRSVSATTDPEQAKQPVEFTVDTAGPARADHLAERVAEPATEASAGLRNQLLGEIRTRLSQYLTYPALARERGWEGRVLLGLRIESDGRLENIRIERGSGYAVLDRSALNSLNRVQRLADASAWLDGQSIDLQLPITYRLVRN